MEGKCARVRELKKRLPLAWLIYDRTNHKLIWNVFLTCWTHKTWISQEVARYAIITKYMRTANLMSIVWPLVADDTNSQVSRCAHMWKCWSTIRSRQKIGGQRTLQTTEITSGRRKKRNSENACHKSSRVINSKETCRNDCLWGNMDRIPKTRSVSEE